MNEIFDSLHARLAIDKIIIPLDLTRGISFHLTTEDRKATVDLPQ